MYLYPISLRNFHLQTCQAQTRGLSLDTFLPDFRRILRASSEVLLAERCLLAFPVVKSRRRLMNRKNEYFGDIDVRWAGCNPKDLLSNISCGHC